MGSKELIAQHWQDKVDAERRRVDIFRCRVNELAALLGQEQVRAEAAEARLLALSEAAGEVIRTERIHHSPDGDRLCEVDEAALEDLRDLLAEWLGLLGEGAK